MTVGAPNPGKAEAGEADLDHANREAVREGLIRGTKAVTVPSLVAVRAPESVAAAVTTLLQNVLVAGGATVAVPPNVHRRAAFAVGGKGTASVLGTTKESAILSTLATLLLLSLRKEEARKGLLEGLQARSVAQGLIHRIPTATMISSSMVTANGQCKAGANSARTANTLIRLTALLLSVLAKRGATAVRGKRVRLLLRSHLEANRRRRSPHLRSVHHLQGKRSPLPKGNEENLAERTTSAGPGLRLPVWRMANSARRTQKVRLPMMTLLSNMTIHILCLHTHTRVSDEKCAKGASVTRCFVYKSTRRAYSLTLHGLLLTLLK